MAWVIVGGGPSLEGFDWGRLDRDGLQVVAINQAAYYVPRCAAWVGIDETFWRRQGPGAPPWPRYGPPRIRPINYDTMALGWGVEPLDDGLLLAFGGHSGFAALNLVDHWSQGLDTVYLLGFDCEGRDGFTAHFHNAYTERCTARVYERFLDSWDYANRYCRSRVVVVGPSRIRGFQRGSLSD